MDRKPVLPACFHWLKNSVILLLVLTAFTATASLAAGTTKIAPGVDYEQAGSHGTTIHILQVDLLQAQLAVYAVTNSEGHPISSNIEDMADKLRELAPGVQEVVAGINAGFFGLDDGVNLSRTVSQPYTPNIRYNLPEFYRQEAAMLGAGGNNQAAQDMQNRFERMRSRFELIIAGDSVRIRPAGLQDADIARQQGWSIIGGGGRLLPGRPASLGVVEELAPDPDFTSKTSRTAVGYATSRPNVLYLITVDKGTSGGVTIAELADIVKNLGFDGKPANIDTAMAMDGGGSTQMWLKNKGTISKNERGGGTRKVTTGIFVLGDRDPLTGPTTIHGVLLRDRLNLKARRYPDMVNTSIVWFVPNPVNKPIYFRKSGTVTDYDVRRHSYRERTRIRFGTLRPEGKNSWAYPWFSCSGIGEGKCHGYYSCVWEDGFDADGNKYRLVLEFSW